MNEDRLIAVDVVRDKPVKCIVSAGITVFDVVVASK